jgi:hypothetical protein
MRLAVGRIGDHVGYVGDIPGQVETVTVSCLLDLASIYSLVGKPIQLNHDSSKSYGSVTSVDSDLIDGVLWCDADITDPELLAYLAGCKAKNIHLETSPTFSAYDTKDQHGRTIQHSRRYESLSILTEGVAGRGGPDVKVKYSRLFEMEEIMAAIAALSSQVGELVSRLDAAMEPMGDEYATGMTDGKEMVAAEYALSSRLEAKGIKLKPSETLEDLLRSNLPLLGVQTEGKDLSYCRAALSLLPQSAPIAPSVAEVAPKALRLNLKRGSK